MRLYCFFIILLCGIFVPAATAVEQREFPVGVYLSWELAHAFARENRLPVRDFLDNSLKLCRERGVNTLWVTNIDAGDLPLVRELCNKYGIRLLANSCEGKAPAHYENDAAPLRFQLDRMRKAAGPELDYWIISDEPEGRDAVRLKTYLELLEQYDPEHRSALVVTPQMVESIIGNVPVDMAAVDPYPFFGPGDPNGPHTRESSRNYFRNVGERFVSACRKAGVEPWLMPQSFAELWGPYRYAEDGMMIAMPGAYLHWITPTVEQTRWQLFESIRQGAQGVIFFQLVPTMLPERGNQPSPDVAWRDVLVREETPAGYGALLTLYGKSTPQFDELGRLFPLLREHSAMLRGTKPAEMPEWFAPLPASVCAAAFSQPESGVTFVVLVNDDLDRPARVKMVQAGVTDLVEGEECREFLELIPGGGAILVRK